MPYNEQTQNKWYDHALMWFIVGPVIIILGALGWLYLKLRREQ